MEENELHEGIAVIGMAGKFPGANNIEQFWENLKNGVESIVPVSDELLLERGAEPELVAHPNYIKFTSCLEDIDKFDAAFFEISPKEAHLLDPQHRMFFELAWQALESAGYNGETYEGRVGVYSGISSNFYLLRNLIENKQVLSSFNLSQIFLSNEKDYVSTHVSYLLNLKGPSISVQTACSSSLVAIHLACESIVNQECSMALAGGISLSVPHGVGYLYEPGGINSPDGRCRSFDANAKGTVFGSGAGIVVLKHIEDAIEDNDTIWAVIKGSYINNDGSTKVGYTAPSVEGQFDVIIKATALAGVEPETIGYVEAHGTGTALGDPVEMEALTQAYQGFTDKTGFCAIGSVKSNVGHLETAAGVTGLIKTVLMLKHGQIPPSVGFETPNPKIDFENSPFRVNTTLKEWKQNGHPRRAAISSFGIGGTNAHAILEEAPQLPATENNSPHTALLPLSAKTETALEAMIANLADHIESDKGANLHDISRTLQLGRKTFEHKKAFFCQNREEAIRLLRNAVNEPEQTLHGTTNDSQLRTAAEQWLQGNTVEWIVLQNGNPGKRVPLPTYPFERKRFWVNPAKQEPVTKPVTIESEIDQPTAKIARKPFNRWFYKNIWKVSPTSRFSQTIDSNTTWLIFQDEGALGQTLRLLLSEAGCPVVTIKQGSRYVRHSESLFELSPGSKEQYQTLLIDLKEQGIVPTQVVHLWNYTNNQLEQSRENIGRLKTTGFDSPVAFMQAWGKVHTAGKLNLGFVCNHQQQVLGHEVINPAKSLILGPSGVIPVEYPNVRCKCVDLDWDPANPDKDRAKLLINDLSRIEKSDRIAYRGDIRFEQSLESILPFHNPQEKPNYREGGIYLITGGLGGIGITLAETITRSVCAKFILLGRSSFPEKESWKALLEQGDNGDPNFEKVAKLIALEKQGAEVMVVTADIQDSESTKKAIDQATKQWGTINGVIHAAGVPGGNMIQFGTERDFSHTLAAKTVGTQVLYDLFRDKKPDFFLFCSSTLAHWGAPGQAAYAGANAFLDAYAKCYDSQDVRMISINWPGWSQVGMAAQTVEKAPTHPLLGTELLKRVDKRIYSATLNAEWSWVLNEHRALNQPVLPGVAYIEMAKAAFSEETTNKRVEISDLYFLTPLKIAEGETKTVYTTLVQENDHWTFRVISNCSDSAKTAGEEKAKTAWTEHATATIRLKEKNTIENVSLDSMMKRCDQKEITTPPEKLKSGTWSVPAGEQTPIAHGPRWNVIRKVYQGSGESLALLELMEEYKHDTDRFELHSGMLDKATSFVTDFFSEESDGIFLPYYYKKIKVYRPIPARCYSHIVHTQKKNTVTCDVSLIGVDGEKLLEINGFVLKKIGETNLPNAERIPDVSLSATYESMIRTAINNTQETLLITPEEGGKVLNAALSQQVESNVLVSPVSPDDLWIDPTEKEQSKLPEKLKTSNKSNGTEQQSALVELQPRPKLTQEYVPPTTETEKELTQVWQNLLGFSGIGVNDSFFDLGGDSLTVVSLASATQERLSYELDMESFFDHATIAALATLIDNSGKSDCDSNREPDNSWEKIPVRAIVKTETIPASLTQQRLWFIDQMQPNMIAYNLQLALEIGGPLNPEILKESLALLVARHESLRSHFNYVDNVPHLVITASNQVTLPLVDLKEQPESDKESEAIQECQQESETSFDLSSGPLFRLKLIELEAERNILVLTIHHIISDAWSMTIFFQELLQIYSEMAGGREPNLEPLPLRYSDYSLWQNRQFEKKEANEKLTNRVKQLEGADHVLHLPTDYPRPAEQRYEGEKEFFEIPKELRQKLEEFNRKEGVTSFMTLLALFQVLLCRYSGQSDFLIGTAMANRQREELNSLIGFFANTLVLRTGLNGDPEFAELLRRVRKESLDTLKDQSLPFDQLVDAIQPERNLSRNPLFQTMFILQNAPKVIEDFPGMSVKQVGGQNGRLQFDLKLEIIEMEESMSGYLEYSTALFSAERVQSMVEHFLTLLNAVLEDSNRRVSELPLLTEREKQRILFDWNQTERDYPKQETIASLFARQVAETPDRIAVSFEGDPMTYREFDQQANRLARYLMLQGVQPGDLVGICMDRSLEMLVGLFAILKAGAAYVPLDPIYPKERLLTMLDDAQVKLLLTEQNLLGLFSDQTCPLLVPEREQDAILRMESTTPEVLTSPQNPAYVIYTSGTTGKPKGVQITHQNLINFLYSMTEKPGITGNDVLLSVTTICFDIFGLELYLPLLFGGTHYLVSNRISIDGNQLAQHLNSSGATMMQATPATWNLLLETGWQVEKPFKALCGGEPLPQKLAAQLTAFKTVELWNMYGPTETTIWSSVERVNGSEKEITIGKPIANTTMFILDETLNPVPVGTIGEIFIGGDGVAPGYFQRPELTAEKFIPDPFMEGPEKAGRLYRTGDLGRYNPDGTIVCLGRKDQQVKLRGFRIELGDIEFHLQQNPSIREAVVQIEGVNENKSLIAWLVTNLGETVEPEVLRSELREVLPLYMVPSQFQQLESIPKTQNGKIDRNALSKLERIQIESSAEILPPNNQTERKIADIWKKIIKTENIGRNQNFFDLGGNSMLLIQLANDLNEQFEKTVTIPELFTFPTVQLMAEYFEQAENRNQTEFEARKAKNRSGRLKGRRK